MTNRTLKWAGSIDDLQAAVTRTNRDGFWLEKDDRWIFHGETGEVINWYQNTKTVLVQGKNDVAMKKDLETEIMTPRAMLDLG